MKRAVSTFILAALIAFALSCDNKGMTAPEELYLVKYSGDEQSGIPGETLAEPLGVAINNGIGYHLDGFRIDFTVVQGIATLSDTSTLTDNKGRAETYLTPGDYTGTIIVEARLVGEDAAAEQFTVTVTNLTEIVCTSNRDGDFDIYTMNRNGTGRVNLTNSTFDDTEPSWSPDGSKIVYTSDRAGNADIFVMNADGTGLMQLTDNPADDSAPCWSPDGTRIAFQTGRDGNNEIYLMNADGTGETNFSQYTAGDDRAPDWAPDNSYIAFYTKDELGYNIILAPTDGSQLINLTGQEGVPNTISFIEPAWSPDSKYLAYVTVSDGIYDIFKVRLNGIYITRLTALPSDDRKPRWSADGSKIVFISDRDDIFNVYYMDAADGTGTVRVTGTQSAVYTDPDWIPVVY